MNELFDFDPRLLENAAQGANCQLGMQLDYAAGCGIWVNSPHHGVASTLPSLNEANCSKARIACAPETRGSLGKMSLENGYERPADFARRKLF